MSEWDSGCQEAIISLILDRTDQFKDMSYIELEHVFEYLDEDHFDQEAVENAWAKEFAIRDELTIDDLIFFGNTA